MATANLNNDSYLVDDGNDSVVIIKDLGDLPGGTTLVTTGVDAAETVIKAGHIIMKDDTTGAHEPLGVTAGEYTSTTTGKTYVGVLKKTILKSKPFAAVLTIGQVNKTASPYEVTSTIIAALPHIQFI